MQTNKPSDIEWAKYLFKLIALPICVLAGLVFPVWAVAATQTVFGELATPAGSFLDDPRQLGLRFKSDVPGTISALRFYREAGEECDTSAHTGYLYDGSGNLLASVGFPASTTTGWQQQALTSPVPIIANTEYVVSVDEFGCYGATVNSGLPVSNGQNLTGLVGVYSDAAANFPTTVSDSNANYFRDIVFEPILPVACIDGGKFVSINGSVGPFVRNSVSADNPDPNAANPRISSVAADQLDLLPMSPFGGTPVFYQFMITNCGTADLYNVRVDDCIDNRSVGDSGFLAGGANGYCVEDPRLIPSTPARIVYNVLTPGESVTVTSADFPSDPISTINVCATFSKDRVNGIVRNDSRFSADADLNMDGTGETLVYFDDLNLVQCKQPPAVAMLSASPAILWPPNHKMIPVTVKVGTPGNSGAASVCKIVAVASNEAVTGKDDGNTSPDWKITGNLTVNLRAERSGKGSGRVYTITADCTDASGSKTTRTVSVSVPHDMGK